jgi:hypothetical protein
MGCAEDFGGGVAVMKRRVRVGLGLGPGGGL